MNAYDPEASQPSGEWLQIDEGERMELVSSYHRRHKIKLPNPQLHAVIHVVVENQVALGEAVVAKTLTRLQHEGLSRHDALHAIGSVLAENLYSLMREDTGSTAGGYQEYLDRLERLTSKSWRAGD